jgi:hypothetical protein
VYIDFSKTKGPVYKFENIQDPAIAKFREGIHRELHYEDRREVKDN